MENSAIILWNDKEVGKVSNIINDMWYLEADWLSNKSEHSFKFATIASKLKAEEIIKAPFKGMVAQLKYDNSSSNAENVLILSLDKSRIFMRSISDEVAAYADLNLVEPWQPADNPTFYENELKKEVTFFHPLRWKKVMAIGIRSHRDDVLFEVLNGSPKYAVVHLTYAKEHLCKFPTTHFYKDWEDLYKNRLLEDHKEWKDD